MARVFITGSSDGLGLLTAKELIAKGHEVVLHARNEARKKDTLAKISGARDILIADLANPEETKQMAANVNNLGRFDAIVHNAGVYTASANDIFAVNVLAPYILTCLIEKPRRLIYLSSAMHVSGHFSGESIRSGKISYSDSKLCVLLLCKYVARKWPTVFANAVNPGWVPTKMGGKGAPDDLQKGFETQVWLATSEEENAKVSGYYFFHKKVSEYNPEADDIHLQEKLVLLCREKSDVSFF